MVGRLEQRMFCCPDFGNEILILTLFPSRSTSESLTNIWWSVLSGLETKLFVAYTPLTYNLDCALCEMVRQELFYYMLGASLISKRSRPSLPNFINRSSCFTGKRVQCHMYILFFKLRRFILSKDYSALCLLLLYCSLCGCMSVLFKWK